MIKQSRLYKKIFAALLAIIFCYVVAVMPFNYRKVKAIAPAVAMLAYSALVSVAMIGLHVNPDGETNFQKAGEAVVDQFKADFIQKYPFDDPVNGTVYRTRLEDMISAWQEGVIDIGSEGYNAFREWAFEFYMNSSNIEFNGFYNDFSFLLDCTDNKYFSLNGMNLNNSNLYGNYFYISFSGSTDQTFYLIRSGNDFYIITNSANRFIDFHLFLSNLSYINTFSELDYSNGYRYYKFYNFGGWLNQLKDLISDISLNDFIIKLKNNEVLYNDTISDFTLSLDESEVYQQVKEIADREIGGTSTQDLIDRAKYLNDMVKQVPQDGSDYINLRKFADEYGGDLEAAAEDLLTGTKSTADVQQGVNVDTTVQGQVITDTETGTVSYDIATPSSIADSVPLVVTPELSIVIPQEYNYPTRYGGEFSFPLAQYFPFCMPFDAVKVLQLLNSPARAPKISIPVNGVFGNLWNMNYNSGQDGDLVHIRGDTMTLDLSKYNTVAAICRTLLYLLFLVGVGFGIRNWLHGGD